MNKKKLIYVVLFLFIAVFNSKSLLGQGSLRADAQSDYIDLQSYAGGLVKANAFGFRIHAQGPLNIANWSLKVRVLQNINYQGKVFDLSKIRIKINRIEGDGYTLQSIGTSNPEIPLGLAEVFIIRNSKKPINESDYKEIYFSFDIYVEGGAYLQEFKSWTDHPFNLVFTLESASGPISSVQAPNSNFRIYPQGTPPLAPVYSIQINTNASNGLLEFKSISDYVNGVSQTYSNGLSVISDTPYALSVKAQSSAFESLKNSIPLNTVSLNLKAVNNSSVAGTVQLSNTAQTIINSVINSGTQPRDFDIRYFTNANDTRLQNAKPDTYKTTLIYTMIPQ